MVRDAAAVHRWLSGLAFFEDFTGGDLEFLAAATRWQEFRAGEVVFEQDQPADSFTLFVEGEVRQAVGAAGEGLLDVVRTPGYPLGWPALVEPHRHRSTAVAAAASRLLAVDRATVEAHAEADPEFGVRLMRRILWFAGDRLRAVWMRAITRRYDDEIAALRVLISENAASLPVDSPLHKLPHYLAHRLTLADAFRALDVVRREGDDAERSLAELCDELLDGVRREMLLYRRLQRIYERIAHAPENCPPEELREATCIAFLDLFADTDHVLAGWSLLPDTAPDGCGHLFILNHLCGHPDTALANAFSLIFDTHYVSSMIVYRRYGRAPMRVVRKSRRDEAGHQQYYDRLGYLYVYTRESEDPPGPDWRQEFFEQAGRLLRSGQHLVLCPEGTCTSTQRSPLAFRPGAFQLAARVEPEPLIVPVAMANFDRKIGRARTAAVIHEPFRISERVADPHDPQALLAFLNGPFAAQYRRWVREAVALAGG
jgi:CRP-like cAMP-binding protein/1-acyl-sn-glycerol-3-phosphate acyltransferase